MEVLEYLDNTGTVMAARVPSDGEVEIKWGAQLTVRESQSAAFFRDGKLMALFDRPGRYVLTTQNFPVLTKLVTRLGYGSRSPFRSEVYFFSMKLFRNLKWGTQEPVIFRDPELQMIRLRAHGMFSIQIKAPAVFLNKVVGTQGLFRDSDIQDYLKNIIITRLIDILGTNLKTIFDFPKLYDELSAATKVVLVQNLEALGLTLTDFLINSITPPEEVQSAIDERTSMQAIGNLDNYLQFKAAKSIQDAAQQSNGTAGAGVGFGAGIGMGMVLPQMINNAINKQSMISPSSQSEDVPGKLEKLKQLLDSGTITQEEFNKKKGELLKQF